VWSTVSYDAALLSRERFGAYVVSHDTVRRREQRVLSSAAGEPSDLPESRAERAGVLRRDLDAVKSARDTSRVE